MNEIQPFWGVVAGGGSRGGGTNPVRTCAGTRRERIPAAETDGWLTTKAAGAMRYLDVRRPGSFVPFARERHPCRHLEASLRGFSMAYGTIPFQPEHCSLTWSKANRPKNNGFRPLGRGNEEMGTVAVPCHSLFV